MAGSASSPAMTASTISSLTPPNSCPKVATIFSLAIQPVTTPTEARQSPKPRGTKIHRMAFPMEASRLSSISHMPLKLKLDKNQISTVEAKITVPAFTANPFTFSQPWIRTLLTVGIRYWGSSIIKLEASLLNTSLLRTRALITATRIPVI